MNFKSFLGEVVQTILISLAIFFFIYTFLVQPHRVRGESMVPNFTDGELLLTEKVTYRLYHPQRGDVVVFKAPVPNNVDYIKRIIGLPGDEIKIQDGKIYINGKILVEPYLASNVDIKTENFMQEGVPIVVGDHDYFVMGDNRGSSSDSRMFGPISKDSIRGRVWLVYFPLIKTGRSVGARIISRIHYGIPDTPYNLRGSFYFPANGNLHSTFYS